MGITYKPKHVKNVITIIPLQQIIAFRKIFKILKSVNQNGDRIPLYENNIHFTLWNKQIKVNSTYKILEYGQLYLN